MDLVTVYVSINNTDDRLSQGRWAMFHMDMGRNIQAYGGQILGEWFSHVVAMWQTACWKIDVPPMSVPQLKAVLAGIARAYDEAARWDELGPAADDGRQVFLC